MTEYWQLKQPAEIKRFPIEECNPETLIVTRTFIRRDQWEEWKSGLSTKEETQ